ncbi:MULTISPECIES: hypothetical protein [Limnospira]|uniref:hypothetical protein n=1 Tax=Limnospira TaxID=2596745 RepID=UPI00061AEF3D|nr:MULTISPECIES: hypothetical protein [unclassified Limnospira]MDT9187109.1 hypothetical protein [Limnospira sp. PMC 894.15]MDT9233198.1 hypothetical protein [Limnospira sp. PMC 917.15]MDY7051906.1 hypothetical protein [Limnospira fusiformis LS22]QJB26045.1 hypothetical protein HFV01_09895 [Limnospira fusiformis SAG 85.79]
MEIAYFEGRDVGTLTVVELWRSHGSAISVQQSRFQVISFSLADAELVAQILANSQETQTDCVDACVMVI